MRHIHLTIAGFIFTTLCAFCQKNNDAIRQAEVILAELKTVYPGISIAVGVGDEVVWAAGLGFADVERNVQADANHQFRYYSLSKSITGIAIAKLLESKDLDLERSIRYYLTDLPVHYEGVKIKYLLNHTSGIRDYKKGEWIKVSKLHCENTLEALPTFINDPLESNPGEKFAYSSFNYVLLSRLIAAASGQLYNDYVRSKILRPFGVDNIAPDRFALLVNEVKYYSKWKAGKSSGTLAETVDNTCKFGGGGFVGTAADLAKLHLAMTNSRVLSDAYTKLYYADIPTLDGVPTGYAFGIGVSRNVSGFVSHSHAGSGVGANAVLLVYPKSKDVANAIVVVILGNLDDNEMNGKVGEIADLFNH